MFQHRYWHHFFGVCGWYNILNGIDNNLPWLFWLGALGLILEIAFPPGHP